MKYRVPLTAIFMGALLSAVHRAQAGDSVADAQAQLTKAYNDYYQAISSGKKTPEQEKELRDQIITPAMQAVNKAMSYEAEQVTRAAQQGAPLPKSSGYTAPPVEVTPETVIDGKDVPKELEFPGAPPGSPKNPPIPSPTNAGKYTPGPQP